MDYELSEANSDEQETALYAEPESNEQEAAEPELTPTAQALKDKHDKDAAFPERMRALNEQIQAKAAAQAEPLTASESESDDSLGNFSPSDVRDLMRFNGERQQVAQAATQFSAKYKQALEQAGVQNFAELKRQNPDVAAQFQMAFQKVQQSAEYVAETTENLKQNLSVRQMASEQKKLFKETPELANDDTRAAFVQHVASATGYSGEDIADVEDPKLVRGLVKAFWPTFQAQREANRPTKIPMGKAGKRRTAARRKEPAALPSVVELARNAPNTALGKRQKTLDGMYGREARAPRTPKPRRTRDHASILYGDS